MFRTLFCGRLRASSWPLLWFMLLAASVAASGNAAASGTPAVPYTHAYQGVRLLAHVDGSFAWHATANDDFAAAHVAIADDGGVMAIVPPRGAYKPHRVYLYDPNGQWQTIAVQQAADIGGPTASLGRYFTWSWNGGDSDTGIYGIDVAQGYEGVPVTFIAKLPQSANFVGVVGSYPTKLAYNGYVALSVLGFVNGTFETGTMWVVLRPNGTFMSWLGTANIDSTSPYDTLCEASSISNSVGIFKGFFGCGHNPNGKTGSGNYDVPVPTSHFLGWGGGRRMDTSHDGSSDGESDYAWLDNSLSAPAVTVGLINQPTKLVSGTAWGFDRLLDDSPIKMAALGPDVLPHVVFQIHAPGNNPAPDDDDMALYAADFPVPGATEIVHRIIGRGDAVTLEDGVTAWIDARQGDVLYPNFSMNARGDIVFMADLVTLDAHGGAVSTGQGVIMVEHGIFGDGFD